MFLLFALSALSLATVSSVYAYQRAARTRLAAKDELAALPAHLGPAAERTLATLRVGDVVLEGEDDWLIVGTVTYREEQETWWVHRLEDGSRACLLEVRKRPEWSAALLEIAEDAPTFGQLYEGLTFRGEPYRLERRGDARLGVEGEGHRGGGRIRYTSYTGPSLRVLVIEEGDDGRRGFAGRIVPEGGLSLMPGESSDERAA